MKLFDGKKHAKKLEKRIVESIGDLKDSDEQEITTLAIVIIGDDSSAKKYAKLKKKFCDSVGVPVKIYEISAESTYKQIKAQCEKIFDDVSVGSVIVQMPLPKKKHKNILKSIPVEKDVDLLSRKSRDRFFSGEFDRIPPTVRAVEYFLNEIDLDISGRRVSVVGHGFLVGQPISFYLNRKGADVMVYDEHDNIENKQLRGELVVLATGVDGLIKGEDLIDGANVIDFGNSDLDMDSKLDHLSTISPSPGGMGPLVVRFLVMNHLKI